MKNNLYKYEKKLFKKNYKLIAGIDEVGRGSLAGPIVVAICILPPNYNNDKINDSKKLSKKQREIMEIIIKKDCIDFSIELIKPQIIDEINPKKATILAMEKSINQIKIKPDYILIDAEKINSNIPNESIIKGDSKSISIAAASILAKVYRDKYMDNLSKKYPEYDFENNKGYGTKKHLESLKKYGPIKKVHRFSYQPIKG